MIDLIVHDGFVYELAMNRIAGDRFIGRYDSICHRQSNLVLEWVCFKRHLGDEWPVMNHIFIVIDVAVISRARLSGRIIPVC